MDRGAETLTYAFVHTGAGWLLVAVSSRGVVWAGFARGDDDPEALAALARRFPSDGLQLTGDEHADWIAAVARHADRPGDPGGMPPLDLRGTPFQRQVWDALLTIPSGETRTYREIAESVGRPTAYRAVAQACGANPVGVVVPCHRVIGSDGSLTGYAGGLEHKRDLLAAESAAKGGT